MRFSFVMSDQGSVESFARVVGAVSRLCRKKVGMRLTADAIEFRCSDNLRDGGYSLNVRIPTEVAFTSYTFSGLSEEANVIILEVDLGEFSNILVTACGHTKIKLFMKKNKPHISVELRESHCVHHMPVGVVPRKNWPLYEFPQLPNSRVGLFMPTIRQSQKMFLAFKNLGAKFVILKACTNGELRVKAAMEQAKLLVCFPDTASDSQSVELERATTRVNIRALLALMNAFQFVQHTRPVLNIFSERTAQVGLKVEDAQVVYIIGGVLG